VAKIVFLGTPEYAVPALMVLIERYQVVAVVTQPDRPAGRGRRRLRTSAVKDVAVAYGLEVFQPHNLRRDRAVVERLRELEADVFVLAAYGQILRREVLEIPPYGVLGLHASLLPRWRGAAPVAAAILHGDAQTGVTVMFTDEGMDTGPIIAQRAVPVRETDTRATLTARLADLAAELLLDTLPAWLAGDITPRPQDEAAATYAPPLDKAQGRIDWTQPADAIDRKIRAFTPWPGAYTTLEGRRLIILGARPVTRHDGAAPGCVLPWDGAAAVATGAGVLVLDRVQPAGRRAMDVAAFVRGRPGFVGSILGR